MAQYPSAPAAFTVKQNGDTIEAQHINNLQEEIIVLTDNLLNGLAHHVLPAATNTYDLGTAAKKWRALQLAGNATIGGSITSGGPVTAPGFIGSGAGLSGVPISGVLNDLTDVTAPSPANGEVLTFDLTTGAWINKPITLPGGGVANLNDLLDVTLTGPVEGQMLVFRSGQWVNETVITGGGATIPPGLVSPYAGATAPAGYLLCDGAAVSRTTYAALFAVIGTTYGAGDNTTTFNVPNLQRRYPLGKSASGEASTLGEVLGLWNHTHTTPAHAHAAGSLSVASHSHSAGSLAVENHTHPAGGLTAGSHTHDGSSLAVASHAHGAGTLAMPGHNHSMSGTVQGGGAHGHSFSGSTGDSGVHQHTIDTGQGSDSGSAFTAARVGFMTGLGGNHTHTLSGSVDGAGDHTHNFSSVTDPSGDGPVNGTTAAAAPGVSGSTGAAAPGVTGSTGATAPALTGNTAAATATVSGATATEGAGTTGSANPPSLVLNYIVKT